MNNYEIERILETTNKNNTSHLNFDNNILIDELNDLIIESKKIDEIKDLSISQVLKVIICLKTNLNKKEYEKFSEHLTRIFLILIENKDFLLIERCLLMISNTENIFIRVIFDNLIKDNPLELVFYMKYITNMRFLLENIKQQINNNCFDNKKYIEICLIGYYISLKHCYIDEMLYYKEIIFTKFKSIKTINILDLLLPNEKQMTQDIFLSLNLFTLFDKSYELTSFEKNYQLFFLTNDTRKLADLYKQNTDEILHLNSQKASNDKYLMVLCYYIKMLEIYFEENYILEYTNIIDKLNLLLKAFDEELKIKI